jgi:glycosyl transferase family 87
MLGVRSGTPSVQHSAIAMVRAFRDADWLDKARATAYGRIVLAIAAGAMLGLVATAHGVIDARGEPVGTDFSSFWTASRLALAGEPAKVYDATAHFAEQRRIFGAEAGYYAFFYPPIYLLVCLPLGLLPYIFALVAWLASTGLAYVAVVRKIGGATLGLLPILAFPAVFTTIGHGQNAFLTTALLGAGGLWLDRRPALAGALFGALAIKPHLALVIPIALAFSGRWRAFAAAALTAVALASLAALVFGAETWRAFVDAAPLAREALEGDLVGPEKMTSVYAAARLLGGGIGLAYLMQAATAAIVCLVVAALALRRMPGDAYGPLIAVAATLASPFLLDYDLTLTAIPLAWAAAKALEKGFLPYEKAILLSAFALPVLARPVAMTLHVPLAPLVLMALFWSIARRAAGDSAPLPRPGSLALEAASPR